MKKENAYDFRKELLQIHEPDIRNVSRKAQADEYMLPESVTVSYSASAGDVLEIAAHDFADFLKTSMNISAKAEKGACGQVTVALAEEAGIDLGEFAVYRGFMIEADAEGIRVYGHDERGAAQGLYYIEDMMSFAKAPVFKLGKVSKKPAFSPQMVHSGYGFDEFPDNYLARIAHEGRDAITFDFFAESQEECDNANDLIARAARYGIDVYAYSEVVSSMHPLDEGAEEFYDEAYGRLFGACPGFRGLILVGESVEFPSRDPHVGAGRRKDLNVDGIPSDKPSAGWYPCEDYPDWLNLVKKVSRKYIPNLDIVFWTYNWGYQPEEARLKLIENLPTDVSLLVTFEMFHPVHYENSVGFCCDYTLTFEGPGDYFKSEAIAAKKRGIPLYSMTNTAGLNWDLGVIPYQPMPYQWIRRFKAVLNAKDEWDLCGIMEGHHYGLYPSFISKLGKLAFLEPRESMEDLLKTILIAEFGEEDYEKVDKALAAFSESIRYVTPSNGDQYGAMRIGPSYPFNLSYEALPPSEPGSSRKVPFVFPFYHNVSEPNQTPLSVRIHDEIKSMEKALAYMEEGMEILGTISNPNAKLERLINMGQFITNSTLTGLRSKLWHVLRCRMNVEPTKEGLAKIYDEMEELLRAEIKNAEATIPLVEQDSRLGWEPYMRYTTDRWHLEWKIRVANYVINGDLAEYRKCIKL